MEFRNNNNTRTILDIRKIKDHTIQSQYSTSPTIIKLIESMRERISPKVDIQLFFDSIFNIATAKGVGLDIWGRILGIPRHLDVDDMDGYFGFDPSDFEPMDWGVFWCGYVEKRQVAMHDEAYRTILFWKAMANICSDDIATLNALLQGLFPGGETMCRENDIMEIDLYTYFELEPYTRSLLYTYGFLSKGAGVGTRVTEIPHPVFGFAEADWEPFDQAPFWAERYR